MVMARRSKVPAVPKPDPLGAALGLHGVYRDTARGADVEWAARHTGLALVVFAGIGVLAGMFGLGAGWAIVPALNLLMGIPLKVAAGSSSLILAMTPSAAWVYINQGAILALVAAPSVVGMMLGAGIGARVLRVVSPSAVRRLALAMLFIAGLRALSKGLGMGA
jgi:uncharacterized membrane protein YfcA